MSSNFPSKSVHHAAQSQGDQAAPKKEAAQVGENNGHHEEYNPAEQNTIVAPIPRYGWPPHPGAWGEYQGWESSQADWAWPSAYTSYQSTPSEQQSSAVPNSESQNLWPTPHWQFPTPVRSGWDEQYGLLAVPPKVAPALEEGQEESAEAKDAPNSARVDAELTETNAQENETGPNEAIVAGSLAESIQPSDSDVVFGNKHKKFSKRFAYAKFYQLVESNAATYRNSTESNERSRIAKLIVDAMPESRFLEYKGDKHDGTYEELDVATACSKTRTALTRAAGRLGKKENVKQAVAGKQKNAPAEMSNPENSEQSARVSPETHDPNGDQSIVRV